MKNFWNTQGEEERHQGSWGTLCEAQIVTCDSGRETSSQVSPINSGDTPEGGDMQNMAWITQRKTLQYNEPSLKYVSESLSGDSTVKTKDMTFICPSNYSTDQRVFPVQIYFQPIYRSSNYGNTKNIKLSKKKNGWMKDSEMKPWSFSSTFNTFQCFWRFVHTLTVFTWVLLLYFTCTGKMASVLSVK